MELNIINIKVIILYIFQLTSMLEIAIIKIIIDWRNLDNLVKLISSSKTWINIFLGLNKILSNVPSIIKLSKWSIPLKNDSQKENPNWIIVLHIK